MAANPKPPPQPPELRPPQDFDAEQAALGSILLEPEIAAAAAFSVVKPSDFYRTYHRQIAAAMLAVYNRNEPVDLVTVSAELRRRNQLEEVGGGEYLTALIGEVPTAAHVTRYANIVAEKSALRGLIQAGSDIQALAFANPEDLGETILRAQAILHPIANRVKPAEAPALMTLGELRDILAERSELWPGHIPNGALSIIFAPPGGGKGNLNVELMRCFTTGADWPDGSPNDNPPEKVLLIDYEGQQAEYLQRAEAYGVPENMIVTPPPDAVPYLTDPRTFDLFREWLASSEARAMFIDSWRDGAPGVNEDSSGEVTPTLTPLRYMARDFDIPIFLDHHTVKKGDAWTLTAADLRGSGAFLAAARSVIGIDKPNAGSEARLLKVLKRNGGPKPEPLGFEIGDGGITWGNPVFKHRSTPRMDEAKLAIVHALERQPLAYKDLMAVIEASGVRPKTGNNALLELKDGDHPQVVLGQDGRYGIVSQNDYGG